MQENQDSSVAVEVYICLEGSWKIAHCNWSYTNKE
jgi:hypothetical protein